MPDGPPSFSEENRLIEESRDERILEEKFEDMCDKEGRFSSVVVVYDVVGLDDAVERRLEDSVDSNKGLSVDDSLGDDDALLGLLLLVRSVFGEKPRRLLYCLLQ